MNAEPHLLTMPGRKRQNRRPTIGMLIQSPAVSPQLELEWQGVVDMARDRDANLICFIGGALDSPHEFEAQANVLYDLVSTEQLDGLVIWASNVGAYITPEQVKEFLGRFRPLPRVSGAYVVPGIPSVLQSNTQGMREAIVHLSKVHGCRRIAFLRGPENHFGAQERYQTYIDALAEQGLRYSSDLISPPVDWAKGTLAITALLDERKLRPSVDFDAIVSANDQLMLAAMRTLQARGIRVPGQVAVIGYDDSALARISMPPLTSVVTPFYELGRQAVVLLLAQIHGEQTPEQTFVPGELIARQSCGCLSLLTVQAIAGPVTPAEESLKTALSEQRERILNEMQRAVGTREPARAWAASLLDGFAAEMTGKTPHGFLRELDEVLRQVTDSNGDVLAWQSALSALRRQLLPYLERESRARAEDLWQQARVAIGEAAARVSAQRTYYAEQHAQTLREFGAELITTFDVDELMDVLAQGLPRLGIPSYYLAVYEDPQQPAGWSRLLLAYNEHGRILIEPEGLRFPSRQLVPEGFLPQDRQYSLMIKPLYFRENQLGYVAFEIGPPEASIYEALRAQISSALQGAILVRRVQVRSAEIIRQNYVLDTFMANVPDRIYFKNREGRVIKANRAYAQHKGLDPDQAIGKSDFDFFPPELAQRKLEQEQAIMRTGQPLLNLEEMDDGGSWALTTKMPLRDEQGQIIGTFGISRDITEVKRAQEALRQARDELEMRVQERTMELVQANQALQAEIEERKRAEQVQAAIYRISEAAQTAASLDELYGSIHAIIDELMPARNFYIALCDFAAQMLHFPYYADEFDTTPPPTRLGRGLTDFVLRSGRSLLATPQVYDQLVQSGQVESVGAPSVDWLGVPLKTQQGEVIGVMAVQTYTEDVRLMTTDRDILEFVSTQVAMAIERRRAEAALQASEARYRSLFDGVPIGLFRTTPAGQRLDVNPAHVRMMGYPDRETFLAANAADVYVNPGDRQRWRAIAERDGVVRDFEAPVQRYDGTTIWVRLNSRAVRDGDGRVLYYEGSIEDITERKRAEEQIRALNRTLQMINEVNQTLVRATKEADLLQRVCQIIVDVGGYRLAWVGLAEQDEAKTVRPAAWAGHNAGYLEATSITWADIERGHGPTGTAIRTGQPAMARDILTDPAYLPWREQALQRGYASSIALPLLSGEQVIGALSLYNAAPNACDAPEIELLTQMADDLAYGIVALRTRTERKQAEEAREQLTAQVREQARQMLQILASVPTGVLLLDAEGRVIQANPVAAGDLAVLAGAEAGPILTHLGDRPLAELLTSPPTKGLWHQVKAGIRTFEVIARPVENGSSPEHWVLVIKDVTREREIQAQLQQQERLAAVGQLAAGIAHDFNNLMAVIVLYAQMSARAPEGSAKTRERLEIIAQQARRATALTQQILDFSRRAVLEPRPLDLTPFLKEIVKLLERTVLESIQLTLRYGVDEYVVNADPGRLQQVILNLAVNARDAMPQGGALRIALSRTGETDEIRCVTCGQVLGGDWVRIAVTDTGSGIPSTVLPHIFEPFFTTKGPGQGSGLGLAQVYGIVKQHAGHIDVVTKVGEGTTFTLYLPAFLERPPEAPALETQALAQGKGETILVVEDDVALRKALVAGVELLNYRVLEAANGYHALDILAQHAGEISLVLSDLVMPEMGGQALFQAMRQRGLALPVVILTGHPMENELQSLQAQGLAGWMPKPPEMEPLSRLLARVLGKEAASGKAQAELTTRQP